MFSQRTGTSGKTDTLTSCRSPTASTCDNEQTLGGLRTRPLLRWGLWPTSWLLPTSPPRQNGTAVNPQPQKPHRTQGSYLMALTNIPTKQTCEIQAGRHSWLTQKLKGPFITSTRLPSSTARRLGVNSFWFLWGFTGTHSLVYTLPKTASSYKAEWSSFHRLTKPQRFTICLLQEKYANPWTRGVRLWGYHCNKEGAEFATEKCEVMGILSSPPFSSWSHRTFSRKEMKWNRLLENHALRNEKRNL